MKLKSKYEYYLIYRIINLINQKSYVGFHSTNNQYDNYLGSGIAIKNAIKKYGEGNFIKEILEYADESNWQEREKYWIEKLGTYKYGYNLTLGGDGGFGLVHSKESKHLMSIKHSELRLSENHKKNISKSLAGRIPKSAGWNKGKKWSSEINKKRSISRMGIEHSEETKKQLSDMKTNLYADKKNHPRSKIFIIHKPNNDKFLCIGTFRKFRDKNKASYNKYFKNIILNDITIDGWYFKQFNTIEEVPNIYQYEIFTNEP